MHESEKDFTKRILKKVKQIEIRSNHLVSEALSGAYHSAFKGQGIDFEEVREYQPGDEVRSIDWNVTAKIGVPYVKQFREERELTIFLAIDVSESGSFGSETLSKRERLAELGALLAFSANRNGDKVGLLLFSGKIEKYIPPAKGQKHVLRLLREILFHRNVDPGTDLNSGLRFINQVLRRRSVVFLLSDFIIPEKSIQTETNEDLFFKEISYTRRKHDLICGQVQDPVEFDFPSIGLIELEDAETGETIIVDSSNSDFQNKYSKITSKFQSGFEQRFKRRGVDFFSFSTETDLAKTLKEFFELRRIRRN